MTSAPDARETSAGDDRSTAEESTTRYENLFVGHVLPILKFRRVAEGEYDPLAVTGTGFTFGEYTLVTCWHCVGGELAEDEVYGVAYRSGGLDQPGYDSVSELIDLGQYGERDLALARIGFTVEPRLTLAEEPAAWGEDVVASGYPLPQGVSDPFYRTTRFESNATMLKGYVTRIRLDDRPGRRPVRHTNWICPLRQA
jgi:Trypsin-like peptidase domain